MLFDIISTNISLKILAIRKKRNNKGLADNCHSVSSGIYKQPSQLYDNITVAKRKK